VDAFTKIAFSLTHKFSDEKNVRCGTIADNLVLSSGSTTDHSSSWVLDLHFVKQDSSVFGKFDLACTANEPKRRLNKHSRIFRS
jgi:hypothetical protein